MNLIVKAETTQDRTEQVAERERERERERGREREREDKKC